MANKDLLKEAIAEAKTIRETAIANAREALEETITPHLRDMLAAKLQEMEAEEVDEVVEDAVAEEVNEEEELAEAGVSEEEVAVAEADDDSEESEEEAEEEEGEAEGEAEEEEVEVKDMEVEDLKNLIRDILAQELGHEGEEEVTDVEDEVEAADDMVGADDEIDLNELLAQLEEMAKDDDMEEAMHDKDDMDEATEESVEETVEEEVEEEVTEENTSELEEALAAIEQLKTELQEVNLLNSKLLYVNKLFKAFNLTESQKVNVITAFDKAETVKEVKLVYETVSENLVSTPAKQTVKEHKSFASAPAGNSTKGEVINEVSDAVRRMQKLAGIIS